MPPRREAAAKIIMEDGTALNLRILDGLTIDDILVQGMKAEGFRVITGREIFPRVGRSLRDYFIRLGVILE